jgi:hypothetical protein
MKTLATIGKYALLFLLALISPWSAAALAVVEDEDDEDLDD